jgi:hypothetical protein
MRKRTAGVIPATVLSAAAAVVLAGQGQAPLIVAYVVPDGELVPIARYDGRGWRNTWPEPIEHDTPLPVRTVSDIPGAWLDQPVPLTWTVWSSATGKQQPMTVTGVDREGSCVQAITLATGSGASMPSDGLAFSRPATVDTVIALEQSSPELDRLRREVAPHFRTAIRTHVTPPPDEDQAALGARVFARARAETFAGDTVVVESAFRDSRGPVFFIEAQRHFDGIPSDTSYDALSYGGWFVRDGVGTLTPIRASLVAFSTAAGKLPRYEPTGIVRFGTGSIWAMSEWGIESQTIVLFELTATRVRTLTSTLISGC